MEPISQATSVLGRVLVTDQDASDAEHDEEGGGPALPARVQPAVGAPTGGGALGPVPVSSQPLGGRYAGASDAYTDAAFAQPAAPTTGVVGLVAMTPGQASPTRATAGPHCVNTPDQGLESARPSLTLAAESARTSGWPWLSHSRSSLEPGSPPAVELGPVVSPSLGANCFVPGGVFTKRSATCRGGAGCCGGSGAENLLRPPPCLFTTVTPAGEPAQGDNPEHTSARNRNRAGNDG